MLSTLFVRCVIGKIYLIAETAFADRIRSVALAAAVRGTPRCATIVTPAQIARKITPVRLFSLAALLSCSFGHYSEFRHSFRSLYFLFDVCGIQTSVQGRLNPLFFPSFSIILRENCAS